MPQMGSFGPHPVGFAFQSLVRVDRYPARHLHGRRYTALRLLDDMPDLMRQVSFLSRGHVDLGPLRVSQSVEVARLR
jgi:hypothetical protein